jgi:hypothetical protein
VLFCSYAAQASVGNFKASLSSMLHAGEIKRIIKALVAIKEIRLQ